jgi:hypothetical protein
MNEVRGEVWDDLRSQDYLPNLVTCELKKADCRTVSLGL